MKFIIYSVEPGHMWNFFFNKKNWRGKKYFFKKIFFIKKKFLKFFFTWSTKVETAKICRYVDLYHISPPRSKKFFFLTKIKIYFLFFFLKFFLKKIKK